MSHSPLRIGVLGGSSFARRAVIPAIRRVPELFTLVGVASRTAEKAELLAREFECHAFHCYETLLAWPDLDSLYIPLPNALHAEWIERALDRGLHLLVEKPLACHAKEVCALCEKAKSRRLAVVENFQFRFHRQMAVIQMLLAKGTIGELRCVRSSFGFPPLTDTENIRYRADLGGGALLDAGVYTIKLSQLFLGLDVQVTAARWHIDEGKGVDIWGGGFIEQRRGPLFCEIAFGFDHHYQCSVELWGSKGRLFTNRIFTAPPGLATTLTVETGKGQETIRIEPDDHFVNMLRHFHYVISCPQGQEEEYRQNIRQAELIDEFRTVARRE